MSFKNEVVNFITKKLIKKRNDEQMLKIIQTSHMDTKYDDNGYRIVEREIPKELILKQSFYKNVRLEEMWHLNSEQSPENQKVILLFHGGGYLGKINDIYTTFMINICEQLKDYRVISVEYTTTDQDCFPKAYEDALNAWEYLMTCGYDSKNIVTMGDSAGGGLALALTMYLRDNDIVIKGYVGFSPWVNLECKSECFTNPKKKQLDPLFGSSNVLENMAKMYVKDNDVKDWRISPLFGSFIDMPRMFITYGTLEALSADIQDLYDKANKETNVVLKVYNRCSHDVQISNTKEATQAWNDFGEFVKSLK